jgi:hypothetical protein
LPQGEARNGHIAKAHRATLEGEKGRQEHTSRQADLCGTGRRGERERKKKEEEVEEEVEEEEEAPIAGAAGGGTFGGTRRWSTWDGLIRPRPAAARPSP